MKKVLFLMFVFVGSLSSCSKSDDSTSASTGKAVTLTIGGVAKTYIATVVKSPTSSLITVDASIGTAKGVNEIEKIHFTASEQSSANFLLDFTYTKAGVDYNMDSTNFTSTLTNHSNGRLTGTFSGPVINTTSAADTKQVAGSFDLSY